MLLTTTAFLALAMAAPASRPAPVGNPDEPPLFVRSWGCDGPYEPFFGTCWAPDGPGTFSWPSGAAVAPDGTIYVIDQVERAVEHYSAAGDFLGSFVSDPQRIAAGMDGGVWLVRQGDWARKVALDGTLLVELGPPAAADWSPRSIDVGPGGEIYVGATGAVHVFDPDGGYLRSLGDFGAYAPEALTVGPDGDIFVTALDLKRLAPDGSVVQEWPGRQPHALELADDGLLYESYGNRIDVSRMGQQLLFQWDVPGTRPFAEDIDVRGHVVLVTEAFDGRIQKWGWGTVVETDLPGLDFRVDETPYHAGEIFDWAAGEKHRVSVPSPQPVGLTTKHDYVAWSDGGGPTHVVTATGGNARVR
ncbi:MAG TPA: NHL repeat-containing protein, partial [bacterium]|nr:NHL repeat-containing protein [bacterium]